MRAIIFVLFILTNSFNIKWCYAQQPFARQSINDWRYYARTLILKPDSSITIPASFVYYDSTGSPVYSNLAMLNLDSSGMYVGAKFLKFINGSGGFQHGERDGNNMVFAGGYIDSWSALFTQVYAAKLTNDSTILFSKSFLSSEDIIAHKIALSNSGSDYIMAGQLWTNFSYTQDIIVAKVDTMLNPVWSFRYGKSGDDIFFDMIATTDGGAVICGSHSDSSAIPSNCNGFLIKVDSSGSIQWTRTYGYGLLPNLCDVAASVVEKPDKSLVVCGSTYNGVFILHTDSFGNMIWHNQFSFFNGMVGPKLIRQTMDNGFIVFGNTEPPGGTGNEPFLLKLDSLFGIQWGKYYMNASRDVRPAILEAKNSEFLFLAIVGYGPIPQQPAVAIIKTDSAGHSCDAGDITQFTYSTGLVQDTVSFYQIVLPLTVSNVTLVPDSSSVPDSLWCFGYSTVEEQVNTNAIHIYPNPFDGQLTVKSSVSEFTSVQIRNILGELCFEFSKSTPVKSIEMDLKNLRPAMYFVILYSGSSTYVKKIVKF